MAYFADLSPYHFLEMQSRAALLNIGWLDTLRFRRGPTPPGLLERIAVATPLLRNPTRGIHACEGCGGEHVTEVLAGDKVLLGMSEVWFPSPMDETVYIAPSLLFHYVRRHGYLPPEAFCEAVLALPLDPAEWDTPNGAFRQLVRRG